MISLNTWQRLIDLNMNTSTIAIFVISNSRQSSSYSDICRGSTVPRLVARNVAKVSNLDVHIKKMHNNKVKKQSTFTERFDACLLDKNSLGDDGRLKLGSGTDAGDIVTFD